MIALTLALPPTAPRAPGSTAAAAPPGDFAAALAGLGVTVGAPPVLPAQPAGRQPPAAPGNDLPAVAAPIDIDASVAVTVVPPGGDEIPAMPDADRPSVDAVAGAAATDPVSTAAPEIAVRPPPPVLPVPPRDRPTLTGDDGGEAVACPGPPAVAAIDGPEPDISVRGHVDAVGQRQYGARAQTRRELIATLPLPIPVPSVDQGQAAPAAPAAAVPSAGRPPAFDPARPTDQPAAAPAAIPANEIASSEQEQRAPELVLPTAQPAMAGSLADETSAANTATVAPAASIVDDATPLDPASAQVDPAMATLSVPQAIAIALDSPVPVVPAARPLRFAARATVPAEASAVAVGMPAATANGVRASGISPAAISVPVREAETQASPAAIPAAQPGPLRAANAPVPMPTNAAGATIDLPSVRRLQPAAGATISPAETVRVLAGAVAAPIAGPSAAGRAAPSVVPAAAQAQHAVSHPVALATPGDAGRIALGVPAPRVQIAARADAPANPDIRVETPRTVMPGTSGTGPGGQTPAPVLPMMPAAAPAVSPVMQGAQAARPQLAQSPAGVAAAPPPVAPAFAQRPRPERTPATPLFGAAPRPVSEGAIPIDASAVPPAIANGHPVAPAIDAATLRRTPLDMRRDDWTQGLIERIETVRELANAADTRIKLVPDALGKIDVSMRRDGDTLHVQFAADVAQTRTLLAEAQPRLAELAQQRGMRLAQGSVDAGAHGQGQQQSQQQQAAARSVPPPSRPVTAEPRDEASTDTGRVA